MGTYVKGSQEFRKDHFIVGIHKSHHIFKLGIINRKIKCITHRFQHPTTENEYIVLIQLINGLKGYALIRYLYSLVIINLNNKRPYILLDNFKDDIF